MEKIDKGVRQWLIPAWAGKTRPPLSRSRRARAHPRVGGENLIGVAADLSAQGSSPRGRGKRILDTTCVASRGLIPAWAGKTHPHGYRRAPTPAHPRVGGENTYNLPNYTGDLGSSPRGRGKLGHAGARTLLAVAHPRVGGENEKAGIPASLGSGSSPRGRGKPLNGPKMPLRDGLIPAWAGKTRGTLRTLCERRAHPRVGGENGT